MTTASRLRAWGRTRRWRGLRPRASGRWTRCSLHAEPYGSRQAWCAARVAASEARLAAVGLPTVLVNHYPLRRDLVDIPRIPRFIPWCGTRRTEDWHRRHRAVACVHGHLHVRGREVRRPVPFLEVSLGYPRQWDQRRGVAGLSASGPALSRVRLEHGSGIAQPTARPPGEASARAIRCVGSGRKRRRCQGRAPAPSSPSMATSPSPSGTTKRSRGRLSPSPCALMMASLPVQIATSASA